MLKKNTEASPFRLHVNYEHHYGTMGNYLKGSFVITGIFMLQSSFQSPMVKPD